MAATNDIYKGMIISYNGDPHIVLDKEFYKPGKGGSFTRTRLKNLKTGKLVNQIFKSGEKIEEMYVVKKTMQYLYHDGSLAYFMDPESFEQDSVELENIHGGTHYLHEEAKYIMTIFEEKIIFAEVPAKITLTVTEAPEGARGNTVSNATKEATLETGVKVQVPLFIKAGDKVQINTESNSYTSKA